MFSSGSFSAGDIFLLVLFIIGLIAVGLYLLNRWAAKRVGDQQAMIEKSKQAASIYVVDKKKTKAGEANLPKAVLDNLPKWYRILKIPLVKAKIGPQIMTLMCDKKVFQALPVKKTVKVELAGIYIVEMKGMKTKQEMKERERNKEGEKKPWYRFWSNR